MKRKEWRRLLRAAIDEVEKDPKILTGTMAEDMVRVTMPPDVLELVDDLCAAVPGSDTLAVLAYGLNALADRMDAVEEALEQDRARAVAEILPQKETPTAAAPTGGRFYEA